jgi:DNA-binding transcriptional ArsR family regulator
MERGNNAKFLIETEKEPRKKIERFLDETYESFICLKLLLLIKEEGNTFMDTYVKWALAIEEENNNIVLKVLEKLAEMEILDKIGEGNSAIYSLNSKDPDLMLEIQEIIESFITKIKKEKVKK